MKQLTLIRHAKSSWKNCGPTDLERPLARRGKKDAPAMGKRLAESGFAPDLLISSSARRARKTAKHVLRALDRSDAVIDDRVYMASAAELLDLVRELDDEHASVALVGHNPGLTDFCELLAKAGIDNIPTMGIAHLHLSIDRWVDAVPGCGALAGFETPKGVKQAKEEAADG